MPCPLPIQGSLTSTVGAGQLTRLLCCCGRQPRARSGENHAGTGGLFLELTGRTQTGLHPPGGSGPLCNLSLSTASPAGGWGLGRSAGPVQIPPAWSTPAGWEHPTPCVGPWLSRLGWVRGTGQVCRAREAVPCLDGRPQPHWEGGKAFLTCEFQRCSQLWPPGPHGQASLVGSPPMMLRGPWACGLQFRLCHRKRKKRKMLGTGEPGNAPHTPVHPSHSSRL